MAAASVVCRSMKAVYGVLASRVSSPLSKLLAFVHEYGVEIYD